MHGYQGIIEFSVKPASLGPMAKYILQPWESLVRKSKLQTKNNREKSTNNCPDNSGNHKLVRNHFMVFAEDIFPYKVLLMMSMRSGMIGFMQYYWFFMQYSFVFHIEYILKFLAEIINLFFYPGLLLMPVFDLR